jgi:hypothetical protein
MSAALTYRGGGRSALVGGLSLRQIELRVLRIAGEAEIKEQTSLAGMMVSIC